MTTISTIDRVGRSAIGHYLPLAIKRAADSIAGGATGLKIVCATKQNSRLRARLSSGPDSPGPPSRNIIQAEEEDGG
jgi:hypothetical protein